MPRCLGFLTLRLARGISEDSPRGLGKAKFLTTRCGRLASVLPDHTLKVRSYIYISVYLFGTKERDIYPSYAITLILHVNHVYKIE